MKRVDIEDLVRWAYREELPKRDMCSGAPGAKWAESGIVGDGGSGGSLPSYRDWMGLPHPDALAVEAAVGRLQELAFDWADLRWMTLGAAGSALRLEPSRQSDGSKRLRPVDACLVSMAMRPAASIVMHARAASRPDCSVVARVKPLRHDLNGKIKVWRVDPVSGEQLFSKHPLSGMMMAEPAYDVRRRLRSGSACPIVFEPTLAQVARDRAEYLLWLAGLEAIAIDLAESTSEYLALPPSADPRPWLTKRTALLKAA